MEEQKSVFQPKMEEFLCETCPEDADENKGFDSWEVFFKWFTIFASFNHPVLPEFLGVKMKPDRIIYTKKCDYKSINDIKEMFETNEKGEDLKVVFIYGIAKLISFFKKYEINITINYGHIGIDEQNHPKINPIKCSSFDTQNTTISFFSKLAKSTKTEAGEKSLVDIIKELYDNFDITERFPSKDCFNALESEVDKIDQDYKDSLINFEEKYNSRFKASYLDVIQKLCDPTVLSEDKEKIIDEMKKGAERSSMYAFDLASIYVSGIYGPQNITEAMRILMPFKKESRVEEYFDTICLSFSDKLKEGLKHEWKGEYEEAVKSYMEAYSDKNEKRKSVALRHIGILLKDVSFIKVSADMGDSISAEIAARALWETDIYQAKKYIEKAKGNPLAKDTEQRIDKRIKTLEFLEKYEI